MAAAPTALASAVFVTSRGRQSRTFLPGEAVTDPAFAAQITYPGA